MRPGRQAAPAPGRRAARPDDRWSRGHVTAIRIPAAFHWRCPSNASKAPRQKSRRRAWIATLVVLTLLVLSGGGLWLYNMMNQAPPPVAKVHVPSVASLTESEALQTLYNAGLKPQISRVQHDTVPKGTAIGTTPASGGSMEPNAEVILNVSDGPSAVAIPPTCRAETEAAARDVLRPKGLVGAPATIMNTSSTVPAGIVITTTWLPARR